MAYRNVSSATGNSSSPAVSPPSGVAENDIVIVGINYDLVGGSMGTPAEGFTELETASWGGDGSRMWVGWKRATASESTYTFSMSGGAARWSISATAFSGRSTGAGVITDSTAGSGAAPTLTAAAGDDLIYLLFCDNSTSGSVTAFSPPTDFTERAEVFENYASHSVSTRDNVSSGATGTVEGTATGADSTYDVLVAIAQGAPATTKKLKLLAHSSAAGATGVAGVVFEEPTGGDITGAKIGEFTGKSFEASLESGQAVLKVPVADFGGSSLTTSDTPVALVRNSTHTSGIVACTVIEE